MSCATPPFEALYAAARNPPWKLSIDAIVTIFPEPRGTISAPASRQSSKTDVRLTSMVSSQCSRDVSSAGPAWRVP